MLSFFKPKIQIVELKNGKFAIMRTLFGKQTFFDPCMINPVWRKSSYKYFASCEFDYKQSAEDYFQRLTGTFVKEVIY
jgi:hypothetical protein